MFLHLRVKVLSSVWKTGHCSHEVPHDIREVVGHSALPRLLVYTELEEGGAKDNFHFCGLREGDQRSSNSLSCFLSSLGFFLKYSLDHSAIFCGGLLKLWQMKVYALFWPNQPLKKLEKLQVHITMKYKTQDFPSHAQPLLLSTSISRVKVIQLLLLGNPHKTLLPLSFGWQFILGAAHCTG